MALPNDWYHQYQSVAIAWLHTQRVLPWDTSMGLVERREVDQQRDRLR